MTKDDLRKRTLDFGVRCIRLAKALPKRHAASGGIAKQLIRCGTSVGANYRAAGRARSRSEFAAKLGIVEEERDETMYWFELIARLELVKPGALMEITKEANELLAITISSITTARTNNLQDKPQRGTSARPQPAIPNPKFP